MITTQTQKTRFEKHGYVQGRIGTGLTFIDISSAQMAMMDARSVDDTVQLTVSRSGQSLAVEVTLTEFKG